MEKLFKGIKSETLLYFSPKGNFDKFGRKDVVKLVGNHPNYPFCRKDEKVKSI